MSSLQLGDMSKKIALMLLVFVIAIATAVFLQYGIKPAVKLDSLTNINLPEGFKIEVFANNLGGSTVSYPGTNPGVRMMLLKDDVLFATITGQEEWLRFPIGATITKLMKL
jgi:hypothetical protein